MIWVELNRFGVIADRLVEVLAILPDSSAIKESARRRIVTNRFAKIIDRFIQADDFVALDPAGDSFVAEYRFFEGLDFRAEPEPSAFDFVNLVNAVDAVCRDDLSFDLQRSLVRFQDDPSTDPSVAFLPLSLARRRRERNIADTKRNDARTQRAEKRERFITEFPLL